MILNNFKRCGKWDQACCKTSDAQELSHLSHEHERLLNSRAMRQSGASEHKRSLLRLPGCVDVPRVLQPCSVQQLFVQRLNVVVDAQHDVSSHQRHAPIDARVDLFREGAVVDVRRAVVEAERAAPEQLLAGGGGCGGVFGVGELQPGKGERRNEPCRPALCWRALGGWQRLSREQSDAWISGAHESSYEKKKSNHHGASCGAGRPRRSPRSRRAARTSREETCVGSRRVSLRLRVRLVPVGEGWG